MVLKKFFSLEKGVFCETNLREIDIDSPSFLYGYNVFETMLLKDGKILFLDSHLARIKRGVLILNLDVDFNNLREIINNYVKSSSFKNGIFRIMFFLHGENTLLYLKLTEIGDFHQFFSPIKAHLFVWDGNCISINSSFKTGNFLVYYISSLHAKKKKCDISIICMDENILETSIGNIVFEMEGKIYTPPISHGILNGIMRQFLLNRKIVEEKPLSLKDLRTLEGIYTTNSVRIITPIEKVKGNEFTLTFDNKNFNQIKEKILKELQLPF